MKGFFSKFWFPAAMVGIAVAASFDSASQYQADETIIAWSESKVPSKDTIIYKTAAYKRWWTEEEKADLASLDSLMLAMASDTTATTDTLAARDTVPVITARDTMKVPEELRLTDPFRYKYYVALIDSATHVFVRDSLKAAGDSLDWPKIDSIYVADSAFRVKEAYDKWYNSLSRRERKEEDRRKMAPILKHRRDSIQSRKDSIQAVKDSLVKNTPRILETGYLPDSLYYKRLITWTQDPDFHNIKPYVPDTSYNYHFNDYRFYKEDLGVTWLGVSGSAVRPLNFFRNYSDERVSFYDPVGVWSYSHSNLPMYNTKVPYTELSYTGTLFAGTEKESDNLHLFTTTNITPELNLAFCYDRNGGNGILQRENTASKTTYASLNYLGKKYLAHAGLIHHGVSREENGGIKDNAWIRDTIVEPREISVLLADASSKVSKNTFFADQQYKIPMDFVMDYVDLKQEEKWEKHYRDSLAALGEVVEADALEDYLDERWLAREEKRKAQGGDLSAGFVGHSSEYSTFTRLYLPKATAGLDSLRLNRLDNKVFIRLQPWSSDAVISKINVGVGDRFQSFGNMFEGKDESVIRKNWNSAYVYAGAEGHILGNFDWDAKANYVFAGSEFSDLEVDANAEARFYPFRRYRKSPMIIKGHFETTLREPDWFQQNLASTDFNWNNSFGKISSTKAEGSIEIPRWKVKATVGYALLANTVYYDSLMVVRQNSGAVSVLSATLEKNFSLFDNYLHLDNRLMFQLSSDQKVVPLPMASANLRYYVQIPVAGNVMTIQLGGNLLYNTSWYTPGYNPALGVFYNQREEQYNNGPYLDAFANIRWKQACIFVKYENAGRNWLTDKKDFFSAHHYINTTPTAKFGIMWPFYMHPGKDAPGMGADGSRSHNGGGHGRGSNASRNASGLGSL